MSNSWGENLLNKGFLVKTAKRAFLGLGIVSISIILLSGCASNNFNQVKSSRLDKKITEYKRYKNYKAMATAVDSNRQYSYGRAWGHSLQIKANQRALQQCKMARKKYNVRTKCKLYMIGDSYVR